MQNPKPWPKSEIQNPNGCAWGCHRKNGYYDNPSSKIQDPKSKYQNPRSKIQDPKSKLQDPKSKIQTPKSKRPNNPFDFWILEFGFGLPGWGGYVANALVWMGWPPKFGVVGRDSSWYAKGRRLDSPRSNRAPISRGWFCWKPSLGFQPCIVEIGCKFPERWWRVVVCQATILWVQLRERGGEKEIKLDAAAFCCHAR